MGEAPGPPAGPLTVGLLPAFGDGLGTLAESGQHARLIDGYLRPYAAAFARCYYFSYLPERLEAFARPGAGLERVQVLGPTGRMSRGRRALSMVRQHREAFDACRVLRVFQLTGCLPLLLARPRPRAPYVTTYGFWYGRLSRSPVRRLLKGPLLALALRRAAAVIATTPALAAQARRHARRVALIPNGVDTRRFRPRPPGPRPPGWRPRVLYVGRLSPEKNLETVIVATGSVGDLPAARPRLTLAGPGPLRAELEALAGRHGVDADFRGLVGQDALPSLYAEADAFVLASFTEGHPKVLLEAMSAGLPCVVAANEGTRSLVTDGETGLLFDARQPGQLAAGLRRVLGDPELAARLGRAARARIVADYDLGALVAREIALLREVAAEAEE
jgi:glycosyltransferase involved in cell wall biosynthesis